LKSAPPWQDNTPAAATGFLAPLAAPAENGPPMSEQPLPPPAPAPPIPVHLDELENLRWSAFFGNDHPVELEIGIGKGGFLLRRAQAYPQRNFLGIEWSNEFYRFAVDRMQRWNLRNVRILRADASYFVRAKCPRDSLLALHVYHPDPWPKRRHHKRRLFQKPFVDAAAACLIPGGRWAVQTDHAEYFEVIRELLLNHPELEPIPFDDPDFGVAEARIATNFEIKYLREGRTMYQLAVRRIPQTKS
jgi:tRNA (guanine-N7-)-methyltransferase